MVLQIIRKRINDTAVGLDGASPEMRVDGGYIQWRQDDGEPDWTNLIALADLQGAQGEVGATGVPGENGASAEFRRFGGWIQWRPVGALDWTNLVALVDLKGDAGDCDCSDEGDGIIPPQNLQMNRCGVAVALTLELKRLYQRAKTDPTVWDAIEDISGQIGTSYNAASASAAALAWWAGITVSSGVAVAGGLIAAGLALINWVSGRSNNGTDHWTPLTEEFLQESLYCVLTRRETITITTDVLREWLGFVNDAEISDDNDYLVQLISLLPVSYWNNEALVAPADINSCLNICAARTGEWAYLIGEGISDLLNWDDPIIRASTTISIGKQDDFSVTGVPTPNDTLLYTVRMKFSRDINLTGLNIGVEYKQSRDAVSPVISVLADGSPLAAKMIEGVSGVMGDQASLCWSTSNPFGFDQFNELTISGTIAIEDADVNAGEYLKLSYVRLCGQDYAPFGEDVINSDPCDDCDDGLWCYEATGQILHDISIGQDGTSWSTDRWNWVDTTTNVRRRKIRVIVTLPSARTITHVELNHPISYGTYSGATGSTSKSVAIGSTSIVFVAYPSLAGDTTIWDGSVSGSVITIDITCSLRSPINTVSGSVQMTRVLLKGLGTNPFGEDNCIP